MDSPSAPLEPNLRIGEARDPAASSSRQLRAPDEPGPGIQQLARNYTALAREALEFTGISIRIAALQTYYRTRRATADNACRAAFRTQHVITRTRDQARDFQRQYPMRVLGILAGIAFLAGIAARVWRSRAL